MSFYKDLIAKGKGAKGWINSFTEVEYLGEGKFGASITPTIDGDIDGYVNNIDRTSESLEFGRYGGAVSPPPGPYSQRAFVEWDVSGISVGSTIIKVEFRYHGKVHHASADNSDIRAILNIQPSSRPGGEIRDDMAAGAAYLSNDAVFPEVGTGKDVGGASGPAWDTDPKTDLATMLNGGWFAFGFMTQETETPSSTTKYYHEIYSEDKTDAADPKPILYVEYTLFPMDICWWLADHGAPFDIMVTDIFALADSYLSQIPPSGYIFIPTIQNVFGAADYWLGFDGDAGTGCDFYYPLGRGRIENLTFPTEADPNTPFDVEYDCCNIGITDTMWGHMLDRDTLVEIPGSYWKEEIIADGTKHIIVHFEGITIDDLNGRVEVGHVPMEMNMSKRYVVDDVIDIGK